MKRVLVGLFLLSVFTISFLPVKDTDFGWHYRCGKEFFTRKTICKNNNFSYLLPRYRLAYSSVVYDGILAVTYDRFGFTGISVLGGLIMAAAARLFIAVIPGALWLKILSYYIIMFSSWAVFGLGLRSQIATYLFFLATLFIAKKASAAPRHFLWLPLLFLLWANTHIGFFIGFIILVLFRVPFVVLLLSFLATLINPFGVGVYREIMNHANSPLNTMIAEWVGPPWWNISLILISGLFLILRAWRNKSITVSSLLVFVFFMFLALRARRNIPYYYTIFFLLFWEDSKRKNRPLTQNIHTLLFPLMTASIVLFSVINISPTVSFDTNWNEYCTKGLSAYPCEAVKKVPELYGNVYAMYEWGGFLIWQKPGIKVFVDGRMPAWRDENGQSPYAIFLNVIQARPGWNETLGKHKTDYLLITNGTFLDLLLQKESDKYRWREIYRDDTAVVYQNIL